MRLGILDSRILLRLEFKHGGWYRGVLKKFSNGLDLRFLD